MARVSQTGKLPRFRRTGLRVHKRVNPREHGPMDMRLRHSAFCNARYSVIHGIARPIIIRNIMDKDFKPIIPMVSDFDGVGNWRSARRKINNLGHLCRHILRRGPEHFHLKPRCRGIATSPARHNTPLGNENHRTSTNLKVAFVAEFFVGEVCCGHGLLRSDFWTIRRLSQERQQELSKFHNNLVAANLITC